MFILEFGELRLSGIKKFLLNNVGPHRVGWGRREGEGGGIQKDSMEGLCFSSELQGEWESVTWRRSRAWEQDVHKPEV